jgi:4-amino-4-deoxy-L-arabinose transferase-like glycosyltransferase
MSNLPSIVRPILLLRTIVVLGIALHWNIWDRDIMGIHAWRQTQTMTVVENFAAEDMNILNPRINSRGDGDGIFRMEFPLMQWTYAWFYKWLGHHLWMARLLTFIISMFSVFGFFRLLRAYGQTEYVSAIGAWCLAWSPVLFYYSVNPLPDNLALCFGLWSLVFLKQFQTDRSYRKLLLFAVFLSLATAVKLPFILFGAGFIPLFVEELRGGRFRPAGIQSGIIALIMAPAASWYMWVIPQWGNTALIGGVGAEESFDWVLALSNIWGTVHSLLPELFINYGSLLFFLFGIILFAKSKAKVARFKVELSVLAFVSLYYIYEVNMIGMVHDYYHFPFLPLLFLVVAAGAKRVVLHQNHWLQRLAMVALLVLPFTAYARAMGRWTGQENEAIHLHKDELRQLTPPHALVVVGNDPSTHIYLYHLGKRGWTFEQDHLTPTLLRAYVERGAAYLYANTPYVETDPGISLLLGEPIFRKDGLTVYPLKPINAP